MIYFIQQEEEGNIKIGHSKNIEQRLADLQVASPYKLILLGSVVGAYKEEQQIHQYLNYYRVQGEWFLPSSFVKEYIISIPGFKHFGLYSTERGKNKLTQTSNMAGTSEGKMFFRNSIISLNNDINKVEQQWGLMDREAKCFWDSFATMFQGLL